MCKAIEVWMVKQLPDETGKPLKVWRGNWYAVDPKTQLSCMARFGNEGGEASCISSTFHTLH